MSYLVFARKWRPTNFDEIIGQEHIATTLKNAIKLGRVAHAYLFSGPRGVGKTSTARIFAKALNCQKGPAENPCNHCDSCSEISEGRSLDVIEIDGASNRGIDQIKQLRENVKFSPAKSRYKIYIIDEVHQITPDGFNALLKTLEEPPAHVKFIFATTAAYKVIPTILSRCQRFDFRPLTVAAILEKLKSIAKSEKLQVSDEALLYIGRAAVGSMRDAESILDQLSSFSKDEVTLETVTAVLGLVNVEAVFDIAAKIIRRQAPDALIEVEKIINEGKDLGQFLAHLTEHFRHSLITKTLSLQAAQEIIDLPADYVQRIAEQAKALSLEELFYIFNVLVRTQENVRRALAARVVVEVAVVKLAQREKLSSLDETLKRLELLEQRLKDTPNFAPAWPSSPGISVKDSPAVENHQTPPEGSRESAAEEPAAPAGNGLSALAEESETENFNLPENVNYSWQNFLQAVREEKMFVASSLEFGGISSFKDNVLTITFAHKHSFYKENLERPENKKIIEEKAREVFQHQKLTVKFVLDRNTHSAPVQGATGTQETHPKASSEPIVQSALDIFQGRIIGRNHER